MSDFFETRMGRTFFGNSVPRAIAAVERLAAAVEKNNLLREEASTRKSAKTHSGNTENPICTESKPAYAYVCYRTRVDGKGMDAMSVQSTPEQAKDWLVKEFESSCSNGFWIERGLSSEDAASVLLRMSNGTIRMCSSHPSNQYQIGLNVILVEEVL